MRFLVLVCLALVAACASIGGAREFSTGQVWRLKDSRFGDGSVTIGAIESLGSRKVVHVSVSGLPGPPTNLPLFIAMQRENPRLPEGEPLHLIASGFAEGEWSPLSADFTIPVDGPNTTISVPHLVVYEERLREAVSVLERSGPPLNSMFDMNFKIWHDTESRWPETNDGSLNQPVTNQLDAVLQGASNLASDQRMTLQMGPPPSAVAEAGEVAIDDPALDQRCREIVSLLKQGVKQDEISEINVTLSNVVVTRSEKWGYVWRADVHDNNAPTNEGMGRSVCWRKTSDEQPAVTSYPLPDVPH